MSPPQHSRRSLLRSSGIAAATLATGGLAGCVQNLGNSTTAGSSPAEAVPPVADAVISIDMDTFFADDGVRTTYNAFLETRAQSDSYEGPTTLEGALDDFEQQEGADLRALDSQTAFFAFNPEDGGTNEDGTGFIFDGEWDAETTLGIVNTEHLRYAESTYAGHTIHEPDAEYAATVGVVGDGTYVIGGDDAVRGVIDVAEGDTDPLGGPVATAYRDTTAGPVRFSTSVQSAWFPEQMDGNGTGLDFSPLRKIQTASGAISREGNTRRLRIALATPDEAAGEAVETVLDGGLTLVEGQTENATTPPFLTDLVADVSISRDGATVALSIERTVSELEAMATEMGEYTTGSASVSQSQPAQTPVANFEFEYDAETRTATITHYGGDTLSVANVRLEGGGFVEVEGVDMTAPGKWAGGGDDGRITAGDSVTVGIEADGTLVLVWSEEQTSSVLAHWEGPEA